MRGARTCGRARRGKGSVQPKRPRSPLRSMAPSAGEAPRRRLRQRRASRAGRVAWPIATARRQRGRWVRDNFLHWLLARPMPDYGPISQGRRHRPPAPARIPPCRSRQERAHGTPRVRANKRSTRACACATRAGAARAPSASLALDPTFFARRDGREHPNAIRSLPGCKRERGWAKSSWPKVSGGTNRGSPYELCEGACIFLESYHYRMAM